MYVSKEDLVDKDLWPCNRLVMVSMTDIAWVYYEIHNELLLLLYSNWNTFHHDSFYLNMEVCYYLTPLSNRLPSIN